jgi:hypothetical protein
MAIIIERRGLCPLSIFQKCKITEKWMQWQTFSPSGSTSAVTFCSFFNAKCRDQPCWKVSRKVGVYSAWPTVCVCQARLTEKNIDLPNSNPRLYQQQNSLHWHSNWNISEVKTQPNLFGSQPTRLEEQVSEGECLIAEPDNEYAY